MPDPRLMTDIVVLLLFGAGIYWIGRKKHKRVSKDSERKYIHGRYIPEWVAFGFVFPGLVAYTLNWPEPTMGMGPISMSAFGLLIGLVAGWIHGSVRLLLHRSLQTTSSCRPNELRPEDGNPYRPPNGG